MIKLVLHVLTLQVCKGKSEESIEQQSVPEHCTQTDPVPLCFWKHSAILQDLHSKGLV